MVTKNALTLRPKAILPCLCQGCGKGTGEGGKAGGVGDGGGEGDGRCGGGIVSICPSEVNSLSSRTGGSFATTPTPSAIDRVLETADVSCSVTRAAPAMASSRTMMVVMTVTLLAMMVRMMSEGSTPSSRVRMASLGG